MNQTFFSLGQDLWLDFLCLALSTNNPYKDDVNYVISVFVEGEKHFFKEYITNGYFLH
jgi:hypothetical protein